MRLTEPITETTIPTTQKALKKTDELAKTTVATKDDYRQSQMYEKNNISRFHKWNKTTNPVAEFQPQMINFPTASETETSHAAVLVLVLGTKNYFPLLLKYFTFGLLQQFNHINCKTQNCILEIKFRKKFRNIKPQTL